MPTRSNGAFLQHSHNATTRNDKNWGVNIFENLFFLVHPITHMQIRKSSSVSCSAK